MTHHQAALGAGDEIQFFTNSKADQRFYTIICGKKAKPKWQLWVMAVLAATR